MENFNFVKHCNRMIHWKRIFPFIIVLLISINTDLSALQTDSVPDSLLKDLNNSKIEVRIKAYSNVMEYYNRVLPEKGIWYGEKALEIAKANKYKKGEADILFMMGLNYHTQSKSAKALDYYQQSFNIRKEIKDNTGIGRCLNSIGLIYNERGEIDKALDYCLQAIRILENENDKKVLGEAYNHIGILYYILGDIQKAEEASIKALNFNQNINEDLVLAFSHENLVIIYIKKKEFDKAIDHVLKTIELREKRNDKAGLAGSYENYAIICRQTKKYADALKNYNKAIEIKKELNNLKNTASAIAGIGITYYEMKQYDKSLQYTLQALEMRKENGEKRAIISSLNRLSDIYSAMEDYKNSLNYYKLAKLYSDSLLNEQKNKSILELQEKYQREKGEKEILLLQQENIKQRNFRNLLLAVTLLISVIAVSAFVANRSKKRLNTILISHNKEITSQKEELQNLNGQLKELIATKDKFFSIISHDLQSPFQGFLGLSEIIADRESGLSPEELSKLAFEINRTANNLYSLLKNLLEWAQMQKGSLSFDPDEISLNEVIAENIETIKKRCELKRISIKSNLTDEIKAFADKKMMNSVMLNLLANAVKFTNKGGSITVDAELTEDKMAKVTITDTGVGMTEEILGRLFRVGEKTGMKGTEGELSTGLGLILCKEFIEKHNGKIWAESEPEKGSKFSFTIPVSK